MLGLGLGLGCGVQNIAVGDARLAWWWNAASQSMVPRLGVGTPTVTRATAGSFVGSNGLIQQAANNAPRFDFDPITKVLRGLRVEKQRTNLLLQSEALDNAVYTKNGSTITANAKVAPDGNTTADKLVEDSSNGAHNVVQFFSKAASVLNYAYTHHFAAGERTWAAVSVDDGSGNNGVFAYFNLATGQTGNSGTFGAGFVFGQVIMEPMANGFYRCGVTFTSNNTAAIRTVSYVTVPNNSGYQGDGASGIYVWGAQLEQRGFATTYIPTTSAAVTYNADDILLMLASITGLDATSFTAAVVFAQPYTFDPAVDTPVPLSITNAGASDYAIPAMGVSVGAAYFAHSSIMQFNPANLGPASFGPSAIHKMAVGQSGGVMRAAMDGLAAQSGSGTQPVVDRLQIGGTPTLAIEYLNGWVTDIKIYKGLLSAAEIAQVTA